jgi:predicted nucleic acid-binding protein
VGLVLVDSNVILDILTEDRRWSDWSSAALQRTSETDVLVINPLIYCEISARFDRIEELDEVVPAAVFRREQLPWTAGFLAAKAFARYRERGGPRHAPITDFYIGAHASVAEMSLLTRDPTPYRTYFPRVPLITP